MNWPTAKLRQVAPPERSARDFAPDEIVWHLNLDQIESQTGRILEKKRTVASEAGSSTFRFDENNVLYSKLRPYLNKVVRPDEPGIATSELVPMRPLPDVLNPDFLKFYLRSDRFVNFANQVVAGAKMPRMIMDKLWLHEMPLPAPREQDRIVELLEQADGLRRQRAEADKLADRILPALFYKTFGDPVANNKHWHLMRLDTIGDWASGGTPSRSNPNYFEGNIDWYSAGELNGVYLPPSNERITAKAIEESSAKVFKKGSLLVGMYDTAAFKLGILTKAASSNQACANVFPNSTICFVEWLYVNLLLMKDHFLKQRRGIRQQNLSLAMIKAFEVPVPPLRLQLAFAEHVRKIDAIGNQQALCRCRLEGLFKAALHRAFTGELTAKWREAHLKELLVEMEHQAELLRPAAETS